MKRFLPFLIITLSVLLLMVDVAPAATNANAIGKVKKVMNGVYGMFLGGGWTRKFPRYDITFGELIKTTTNAAVLIEMKDNTELYIGERAELIIDEFVYNPNTGKTDAIYEFNIGVMRFVSGGITEGEVTIITPLAHIGIRGSEALIFVTPNGETVVNVLDGQFSVRSQGGDDISVIKNQNIRVSRGEPSRVADGIYVPKDIGDSRGEMTRFKDNIDILKQGGLMEKSNKDKISGGYGDRGRRDRRDRGGHRDRRDRHK